MVANALHKAIAIIPARGGSTRIKKKNIVEFDGMPLIYWTIKAALECNIFNEVVVSTEDSEIATLARQFGASVPFFRESHFDNFSPVSLATVSTLQQAEKYWNTHFDYVIQLMPTCPNRGVHEISTSVNNFLSKGIESQISCSYFVGLNPNWLIEIDNEGNLIKKNFDETKRSQDLPKLFTPTGAIWIATRPSLMKHKTFYAPGHKYFPLPFFSSIDIDEYEDIELALAIRKYLSTRDNHYDTNANPTRS